MRVIVKARHMDLTPSLKEHAEQKLGKALMRIVDKPSVSVEIELNDVGNVRDGTDKECRVTVTMPRGKTINIVEVDDDMYKAIDLAHDRLLDKVKREREKRASPTTRRKAADKVRQATAREQLTTTQEPWEAEVAEFEGAVVRN